MAGVNKVILIGNLGADPESPMRVIGQAEAVSALYGANSGDYEGV